MARPQKPYKGVLCEPMRSLQEGGWPLDLFERVIALGEHYGVEDPLNKGQLNLLLELARDHVSGFKIKRSKTLKDENATKDIIIWVALGHADEDGRSVKNAARHLSHQHPEWGLQPESIRSRYNEMKRADKSERGAKMLRRMRKLTKRIQNK